MEFTAEQIAGVIGGKVEGDANASVFTFAKKKERKAQYHSCLIQSIRTIYMTQNRLLL